MSHVRSLNKVILIGRVGKDPEITHIPNLGKDVAKFSIATNEGYMDRSNQWQETTEWHNIVAWGPVVKIIERNVQRGAMVMVEGRIKTRKWQDKNGNDRYSTEINLDTLVVLERTGQGQSSGRPNDGGSGNYQPAQAKNEFNTQAPPEMDINSDLEYHDDGEDPF